MHTTNSDEEHAKPEKLTDGQEERSEIEPETQEDEATFDDLLAEEQQKRLQLMADFQNYQKRIELEKATWSALANMGLIQDILEIYDDLDMALNDEALDVERAKHSFTIAQEKITAAVERAGIEKVSVNVGDEFDNTKMEAVSTINVPEDQQGRVIAVITSAYKYKSKDGILKPAKVVVGK